MGAVTVSLGLFVSCKDTNEDLYKQLEWKVIDGNSSLEDAIKTQEQQLKQLKDYIDQQLALIKQCNCPDDLSQTINQLTIFMNKMTEAASDDNNSLQTLKELIEGINSNYDGVNNFFNSMGVSKTEYEEAIRLLNERIDAIKQCQCDLSKLALIEQTLQEVQTLANTANNNALQAIQDAAGAKQTAQDAANKAQEALNKANNALNTAGTAKETADAAKQAADAAKNLAESLESIAKAADKLSKENAEKIQKNADAISDIKVQMIAMSDSLKHAYETADKAWTQAFDNKTAIELMDSVVKANKTAIDSLKEAVAAIPGLQNSVNNLNTSVNNLSTSVNNLYNKVDSLGNEIDDLKDEIIKLYAYADDNLDKAKAYADLQVAMLRSQLDNKVDQIDFDQLRADFDNLDKEVGDLYADITNLKQKDIDITADLDKLAQKFEDYKDSTDTKILNNLAEIVKIYETVSTINDSLRILDSKIDGNTILINAVQDSLDATKTYFEDKILLLQEDIKGLDERIKANKEAIDELTGEMAIFQENLRRQVTGIIVQQTYNPAFGTVNLPFGVQSNVLLTYYGEATQPVYFPTARTANYVDEKYSLTSKDLQMLELSDNTPLYNTGEVILQNEESNAGKLYLTVNPNTVDFEGLQLSLVNSQDQESYVKLGKLERSDKNLQLGFSRADNGFYECPAYVSPEDVNKVQKVNFNASLIKKDIEEIINKRTSADFKGIASDMAEVIKGLRLDANAVKCEWTDSAKAGVEPQKHAVYSNYNLAATAVKPLSLQTAKDFHYVTIPGYERAMSLLDSLSSRVKNSVHTVFKEINGSALVEKVVNLQINDISVPDLSDDLLQEFILHMDTTFVMDGLSYHLQMPVDVNVPVKFERDLKIPVKIDSLKVSVPVHMEKDVEVDLSGVYITTPTVVVKGSASGHPSDVHDKDGNPIAALIIPVLDNDGNVTGYTEIPMDSLSVSVEIEADNKKPNGNAGDLIRLNGTPIAKVVYDDTFTGNVNINDTVAYHLVIEDNFATTVNLDKWFYFGDNGTDQKSFNLVFKYDMTKSAKDLWGVAQDALGDVNDMLADIRDIVKEVNNLLDKVNGYETKITNAVDKYIDKITDYLETINKKIVDFVNNTNSYLQPTLIASDGTGTKMLSRAKNYPTKMKAGVISMVPTTWTLELAVPLAKKHVAVTNVFKDGKSAQGGNGDCKEELVRVNGYENMNTVLSGDIRRAYAEMKSGYTYEVAYSALDFHGKIATRKYYITIE